MGKVAGVDDGQILVHWIGADGNLPDPFAHHASTALGGVHTVAGDLIGWAHRVHQIPVKARSIAVTTRGIKVLVAQFFFDLAIKLAPHWGRVNRGDRCVF